MNLDKLNPWNWFEHEEGSAGSESVLPVSRERASKSPMGFSDSNPLVSLHREMDRIFDNAFENFGFPSLRNKEFFSADSLTRFQPKIDVAGDAARYEITLDVPGLAEKDLSVDVSGDVLTIRGQKEEKQEEKDKHFYRVERNYGSFQRTLALPSDAVGGEIDAKLENGVLTLQIPRRDLPETDRKKIEIKSQ